MFTGLVEECGKVLTLERLDRQARLRVFSSFAGEVTIGDSIAVNGCCLTAVDLDSESISFDILTQTLEVTSLGHLEEGSAVNLERSLRLGDRLGGHFVQGHIDGTGMLENIRPSGQDHVLSIRVPDNLEALCIDKGSLAVDGISLTIAEIQSSLVTVWIIPHTFAHTNLQTRRVGDRVNLEVDMLAKHVAKLVAARNV